MNKTISLILFTIWVSHFCCHAQSLVIRDTVCCGSTAHYKISNKNNNLQYTWGIYNRGGSFTNNNKGDSISINWDDTAGTDSIWVFSTNLYACASDTAKLTVVRIQTPTATFDKTMVCQGSELEISLNGIAPFVLSYTFNDSVKSDTVLIPKVNILNGNPGNYTLNKITDKYCSTVISNVTNTAVILPLPDSNSLQISDITNPDTICIGTETNYNISSYQVGSSYTWGLYQNKGVLAVGDRTDSLSINWHNVPGNDSIWVYETTREDCTGDSTIIRVERVNPPSCEFDNESVCYGSPLNILITGTPPFGITYSINDAIQSAEGISSNIYTLESDPGKYKLLQLESKYCKTIIKSGTASSEINPQLNNFEINNE